MPENDVTKMKVADLKRELKLRGLATTGHKSELQDRLQTALIDGEDLSFDDHIISGEELLDEDGVLSDEDEAKILAADELDLLQSPDIDKPSVDGDALLDGATSTSSTKKVILKRKTSITLAPTPAATASVAKADAEPVRTKMSERNPIKIDGSADDKKPEVAVATVPKIAQLTLQERLEMRAKKFGISANAASTTAAGGSSGAAVAGPTDAKQIETLKKRAERFGCVVAPEIAKLDAQEKLLKRKERFGIASAAGGTSTTSDNSSDAWAEKKRLRLERFKLTSNGAGDPAVTTTK